MCYTFFLYSSGDHRDLHSFPTRRSSDLIAVAAAEAPLDLADHRQRDLPFKGGKRRRGGKLVRLGHRQRGQFGLVRLRLAGLDRKSTRLNSSHVEISYAVFCLKKKKKNTH